jgi:hypothetical protein
LGTRRVPDKYPLPEFGDAVPADITPAMAASLLARVARRAPTASNDLLRFMRRVFRFAVRPSTSVAYQSSASSRKLLRAFFQRQYRFRASSEPVDHENRLKIVDWEAGALYWNVRQRHGDDWERHFRDKFGRELPAADLMFLLHD